MRNSVEPLEKENYLFIQIRIVVLVNEDWKRIRKNINDSQNITNDTKKER